MTQGVPRPGREPGQETFELRSYILAVTRKWWVVAAVFGAAVLIVGLLSLQAPNVYEARTKLLIVSRVSERLASESPAVGASLSIETLLALATANDLVEQIISALKLQDDAGDPWPAERLAEMLRPKVEKAGEEGAQASLPVLTMTVRGGDPKEVKRIANAWAEAFVQRNAEIFATETARSYEFVAAQYQETQKALSAKQDEKLAYAKANPLTSIQSRLEVTSAGYKDFLSQLQADRARLAEAQVKVANGEAALEAMRKKRAEKVAFQKTNPVVALRTELSTLSAQYQDFGAALLQKEAALAEVRARVQSLSAALAAEPRVTTVKRSIPSDSLFTFLGTGPSLDKLRALGDLELMDEQLSPFYLSLKSQLDQAQTAAASYAAEVGDLESRTAGLKSKVEQLATRVAEIDLKTAEFDDDIAVLDNALVTTLATAKVDVARLTQTNADLELRTSQFDTVIQRLSESIAQTTVDTARFDLEIDVLTENFNQLARSLQAAGIAKAEQAGSIRVVEAAVEPRQRIAPDRRRNIVAGGVAGLFLGMLAALAVDYLQGPWPATAQRPKT